MSGRIEQSAVLSAVVVMLLGSLSLFAQNSGIVGTVTDQSQSLVPDVVITATNLGTNETRRAVSDKSGQYSMPNLAVGAYRLEAEHPGFQRSVVDQVRLEVQLTRRVDFSLELGKVGQQVSVTASPGALETTQSSMGTLLENKMVAEIPLNGRDFLQLQVLLPGVTPGRNGFFATTKIDAQTTAIGGGAFSVNGQRPIYNEYYLDGISFEEWENNTNAFDPSIDAIDQFRTQTSNYSAEFGINAAGLVNMVMKSGSNRLHGTAYEFVRNDKFDAANFFTNFVRAPKPPLRRNQFGGTVGGPIIHDKTFFFASYEGFRELRGQTLTGTYPTAAMDSGDFSQLLTLPTPITIKDPSTGVAFPNNKIPNGRALSFWPAYLSQFVLLPNLPGLNQNYVTSKVAQNYTNQGMGRLDHRISQKLSLDGHYVFNEVASVPSAINPLFGSSQNSHSENIMLNATYVESPTTVIDFRAGYAFFWQNLIDNRANTTPYIARDIMAIQGIPNDLRASDAPAMSVTGFNGLGASVVSTPRKWINERYEYHGSVYSHFGKHDLRYGIEATRLHNTFQEREIPNGSYSFNGTISGYSVADMLLGIPANWSGAPDLFDPQLRASGLGPWIQDDWHVTPKLTLNVGLRYEWFGNPYSKHGNLANVRLQEGSPIATVVIPGQCVASPPSHQCYLDGLTVGKPSTPSTLDDNDKNFAPRFGFAYRLGSRTVVRSAYGVFFQKEFMGRSTNLATNPPFVGSFTVVNTPQTFQQFSFQNPYAGLAQAGSVGFQYVPEHSPNAYLQTWNFAVQRDLGAGISLEVGYVGNKGTHQEADLKFNQPPPGPGALQPRRPYSNISSGPGEESVGNSTYHGLQVKTEKRFSNGLSFLSAYTWSHAEADSCDFEFTIAPSGGCVSNEYNLRTARGLAQDDQRQRFTLSSLYALPVGKGQHFMAATSPVVGKIVSGWQLGTILTLATGQPLTPTLSYDNPNVGAALDLPNSIGNPNTGPKTVQEFFNTSVFTAPVQYTFGNTGVGTISGPGVSDFDFSVLKNTSITERVNLQFRSEFFNLANHAILGDPNTVFGTLAFGTITATRVASRDIQFSLRLQF